MSLPVMHIAVGIGFPFLGGLAAFLKKRRVTAKLLLFLLIAMPLCGLWSEIPDMPRYLPEQYRHLENDITKSKYSNIFFFHKFLDTHQTEDRGLYEGAVVIFFMFFSMLFACSWTVFKNQKEIDGLKQKSEQNASLLVKNILDLNNITDFHCHILPGVDDGPDNTDEALRMCRKMQNLGIASVVATPHMPWQGNYEADKIIKSYNLLKKKIILEGLQLRLYLGADIKIDYGLLDKLKKKEVFTIAGSRYFLLELDDIIVPQGVEELISRCIEQGFYPIITHPERNSVFQSDYRRFEKICKAGALIQITASSMTAGMNKKVRHISVEFLKQGMVHIIASDAHSATFRLDDFHEGLICAQRIVGFDRLKRMVVDVPQLIIENADIEDIVDFKAAT